MMTNLGQPDRPVHRAAPDARPRRPVREARLAGHAQRRRGPRDQQPAGLRRQQPRRASSATSARCWTCSAATSRSDGPARGRPARGRSPRSSRLDEECDLPYIKENLGKILGSTRQGVKRVADIVHNLRGFARLDRGRGRPGRHPRGPRLGPRDDPRPAPPPAHRRRGADGRAAPGRRRRPRSSTRSSSTCWSTPCRRSSRPTARTAGSSIQTHGPTARTSIVEISDNGCGIPAEVLPQIFDPFFTTKAVGRGHRPGPEHHPRHRPGPRRPHRGREHARRRAPASASSCRRCGSDPPGAAQPMPHRSIELAIRNPIGRRRTITDTPKSQPSAPGPREPQACWVPQARVAYGEIALDPGIRSREAVFCRAVRVSSLVNVSWNQIGIPPHGPCDHQVEPAQSADRHPGPVALIGVGVSLGR